MVHEEWRLTGDDWVADAGTTVVALDGSGKDDAALHWAAADAARTEGDLLVVTVVDDSLLVSSQASLVHWMPRAEEILESAATEVEGLLRPGRLHRLVLAGDPAVEITRRFPGVRAVVVGRRGLGALERVLLGSTSAGVVARSLAPVVMVPDEWRPEQRGRGTIVVGVDPEDDEERMLALTFTRAERLGVPVVAVHASGRLPSARPAGPVPEQDHAGFAVLMDKWAAAEVELERVEAEGAAASALLSAAQDAQLVVIGRSSRALLPGVLLGTTTRAVLHYVHCPVMVVPDSPDGGEDR